MVTRHVDHGMKPLSESSHRSTADDSWTVGRILQWTTRHLEQHQSDTPRLDTEILLAHARGCKRIELYTQFDEELSESERAVMRDLVRRRAKREPVAYLVGYREFFGLEFVLTQDVLIPRPETESLVLESLEVLNRMNREGSLADIGTGSGCVAIAIAANSPTTRCTATDISNAALQVARENAHRHEVAGRVDLRQSDVFDAFVHDEYFDVIVSNPPYVASTEIALLDDGVRAHEPHIALDGGSNGQDVIRRIIRGAGRYLYPGGMLLLEIAPEQADAVLQLAATAGEFKQPKTLYDLSGRKRVVRLHRR